MLPKDALGAFTEHVDRRFHDFEAGMKTKLIDAMLHEDKLLNQYIEKNRLTEWVRTALEVAQNQCKEEQAKQKAIPSMALPVSLFGKEINTQDPNGTA
jgi:nuclear pore complex protein Nup133